MTNIFNTVHHWCKHTTVRTLEGLTGWLVSPCKAWSQWSPANGTRCIWSPEASDRNTVVQRGDQIPGSQGSTVGGKWHEKKPRGCFSIAVSPYWVPPACCWAMCTSQCCLLHWDGRAGLVWPCWDPLQQRVAGVVTSHIPHPRPGVSTAPFRCGTGLIIYTLWVSGEGVVWVFGLLCAFFFKLVNEQLFML